MRTSRSKITLMTALLALMCLTALAAQQPEWTFPLPANLLENKSGYLTLVSQDAELPGDFVPYNLVRLSLRSVSGPHELRKEAALALEDLFEQAQNEGYELYVKSSYRSYQTQRTMYYNRLKKYNKMTSIVTSGVGLFGPSIRIGTKSEIAIINLKFSQK